MPSIVIGGQSGGHALFASGLSNPWSGKPLNAQYPAAGIQLRYGTGSQIGSSGCFSGLVYVGLSGAPTINSGQLINSGGPASGLLDGFPLAAGDSYFVPRLATGGFSGTISSGGQFSGFTPPPNLWFTCDAAASGQARIYFEIF